MNDQLSEVQAYRHLLEVAENIIESMDPDRQIMLKYDTLKKAVRAKIKTEKVDRQSAESVCHQLYKNMVQHIIGCLTNFEAQMENKLEASMQQSVFKFKQQFNRDVDQLNSLVLPKKKQMIRQEVASCQYLYKEVCGKFDNLNLLLEIHVKMHQIIEQAAGRELSRQDKDVKTLRRVEELEQQISHIHDAQQFLKRYRLASAARDQFKLLQKQLRAALQ